MANNTATTLKKIAKIKYANTERVIEYFNENPLTKSRQVGLDEIKAKLNIE
jgi:hypothetical protein